MPRLAFAVGLWAFVVSAAACTPASDKTTASARYQPRTRAITITTVPLLVHEQEHTFPFLHQDFAKQGVLDGLEVYGYSPSTLVAYAGDTLQITFVNPEDDAHTFVIDSPDLPFAVGIPPQKVTTATLVTRKTGLFNFHCTYPAHSRSMQGELVVLDGGQ
jgi:plastocyanin